MKGPMWDDVRDWRHRAPMSSLFVFANIVGSLMVAALNAAGGEWGDALTFLNYACLWGLSVLAQCEVSREKLRSRLIAQARCFKVTYTDPATGEQTVLERVSEDGAR